MGDRSLKRARHEFPVVGEATRYGRAVQEHDQHAHARGRPPETTCRGPGLTLVERDAPLHPAQVGKIGLGLLHQERPIHGPVCQQVHPAAGRTIPDGHLRSGEPSGSLSRRATYPVRRAWTPSRWRSRSSRWRPSMTNRARMPNAVSTRSATAISTPVACPDSSRLIIVCEVSARLASSSCDQPTRRRASRITRAIPGVTASVPRSTVVTDTTGLVPVAAHRRLGCRSSAPWLPLTWDFTAAHPRLAYTPVLPPSGTGNRKPRVPGDGLDPGPASPSIAARAACRRPRRGERQFVA